MKMENLALALLALSPVGILSAMEDGWHADPDTFVCTWLVTDSYANDAANTGFGRDWVGEATVRPRMGADWRYFDDRLFTRSYDSYNDLYSHLKIKRGVSAAARVVYAHTYLHVPSEVKEARIGLGYHSACRAWLNGIVICDDSAAAMVRDQTVVGVTLRAGWNRLLVKVANRAEGPLGFYVSVSKRDRQPIPRLTASVQGGDGPLAVCTRAMADIDTPVLPNAYRDWPYVRADSAPFLNPAEATGWKTQVQGWYEGYLVKAPSLRLQAQGGTPTYLWTLTEGTLPAGLSLETDGRIGGMVAGACPLGTFTFSVQVTDAAGAVARADLAIVVRERPNRWVEECGLIGLIHSPENLSAEEVKDMAKLMKRQGYGLAMPIGYGNGAADDIPRWKSVFQPDNPREQVLARYKRAIEGEGMRFGLYLGELELPKNQGQAGCLALCEEAYTANRPSVLWIDHAGRNFPLMDAVFSMWRAYDEEVVIIKNGVPSKGAFDWDMLCCEGWGAWGDAIYTSWPTPLPWFKKHRLESWRFIPDPQVPELWGAGQGEPTWRDYVPVFLSLIAEGVVADLDHSLRWTPGDEPTVQHRVHQGIAEWANPPGKPSLVPSYVNVFPGPLLNDGRWGYNVINAERTTIYLYILRNGLDRDGALERLGAVATNGLPLSGCEVPVRRVTLMNTDTSLRFEQDNQRLIVQVPPDQLDPAATIVRIDLAAPHPPGVGADALGRDADGGINLAYKKPAKLLSLDCKTELGPSALNYAEGGVDGRDGTVAQAGMQWPWVFHVDLQAANDLARIRVLFGKTCFATEYKVMVSEDGDAWREVVHARDATGGDADIPVSGRARYVRVFGLKP
ncbi:MAG: hypothetical protein HN380_09135, partial [Victivallales bacterium]|nr:hypothetical protein [Victivallales bacterium]